MSKCKRSCYTGRAIHKIWLPVILVPLQLLLCLPSAQKTYFSTILSFFLSVASRNNSGPSPDHPYPHFSTAIILHLPTKTKQTNRKHTTTTPRKKSTCTMLSALSHLLPTWLDKKSWFFASSVCAACLVQVHGLPGGPPSQPTEKALDTF